MATASCGAPFKAVWRRGSVDGNSFQQLSIGNINCRRNCNSRKPMKMATARAVAAATASAQRVRTATEIAEL